MYFRKNDKRVPAARSALALRLEKRPAQTSEPPSIISADLMVHGTLESTGDIQVDGRVEGDVRSARLVISNEAAVQGDIVADDVIVRGSVQGTIHAPRIQCCSTSHVKGRLLYNILVVEIGARLDCACGRAEKPLADDPEFKNLTHVTTHIASGAAISKSPLPPALTIASPARGTGDGGKAAVLGMPPQEVPTL